MPKTTFRVVTRGPDGGLRVRDYPDTEYLAKNHTQIGIDDCSTDLELRGMPVFKGMVGPMPDGKTVARYESPEVFETLTKEWALAKDARRRRRRPGSTANPQLNILAPTELEAVEPTVPEASQETPQAPLMPTSTPTIIADDAGTTSSPDDRVNEQQATNAGDGIFSQAVDWLRRSFKAR